VHARCTSVVPFFVAALILAATPGPGIFYVLARTLGGGRREGILSSLGTFAGGMFHVFAAALGISAILAASAAAFHTVKYAGAAYLMWLGIRMIRTRNGELPVETFAPARGAFGQGIVTEVLNPKTALFFLSFIPQFISLQGRSCLFAIFDFWHGLRGPEYDCGFARRFAGGFHSDASSRPAPHFVGANGSPPASA